jgi:hypothetical protein
MRRTLLAAAVTAVAATPAMAQSIWMTQPTPAPNYPYQSSWTNTYGAEPRAQFGAVARPYGFGMTGAYAMAPGHGFGAVSGPYAAAGPYDPVHQGLAPAPINPDGGPWSSSSIFQ